MGAMYIKQGLDQADQPIIPARVTVRCENVLPETEEIPVEAYTALQEELDAAWEY